MSPTISVAEAGFRFIPAVFQYSGGVAAEPGFTLERIRFAQPVPLVEGFARIAAVLDAVGRPKTASPPSTASMAACCRNGGSSATG
jgi:hypothetical protein